MTQKIIQIPIETQYIICKEFEATKNIIHISVIMVHGWSSSDKKYVSLGKKLVQKGFDSLAINLRGHSDSPYQLQEFSRQDHEKDILAAIKYMKIKHPHNKIALLGKSYGGYLSTRITSIENIDYLILSQPALYPDEKIDISTKKLINKNPNIFKQNSQQPDMNQTINAFSKFSGPILFIESEFDKEVPKKTTRNYLKYASPKTTTKVIKNADHSLSKIKWRDEFYNLVLLWLNKECNLPCKSSQPINHPHSN